MACVLRRIFNLASSFSSQPGLKTGKRYLFSSEILGVENFKRIRIFEKDKLADRRGFVKDLSASIHANLLQNKCVVHDLVKLIYITDSQNEVTLVTQLLKQMYCVDMINQERASSARNGMLEREGPLSPRRFQFGPLVFRLLYILKDPATAQALYEDQELRELFKNTTCHLLLMDMLYDRGCYQQVVEVFAKLQLSGISAKFTPDCTTLALAALYQLNTAKSCQEMKRLLREARNEGCTLSRRSLLFAAALALRQGDANFALGIAQSAVGSNEVVFKNIRWMALAEMGCLKEVLINMEEGLRSNGPPALRSGIIYSDTVKMLTDKFATSHIPELETKLNTVVCRAEAEGLCSPQTVQYFVNRPILPQRRSKTSQSFKTKLKSPVKMK